MNLETKKRRQGLKVIISEAIMLLAVIITVIILALLVSGYWLNSDLKVERQGMLQIASAPTGADVLIDGTSSWLQRTNTSKVLSAGEHTVTLTKEGYDSWSKTINISEGLLYRIHYPRLFLQDRVSESYYNTKDVTFASFSPDHEYVLLANDTLKWSLIRLTDDKPESQEVDISNLLTSDPSSTETVASLSTGEILSMNWSHDGSHVLLSFMADGDTEWLLLDVKHSEKSINLEREFKSSLSEVQILDNSASNLLATQDGNLRKIDVSGRSISPVLAEKVSAFDHFDNEVVFIAEATIPDEKGYHFYAGSIKIGDDKIHNLKPLTSTAEIVISKFYDDKYITILQGDKATVYFKDNMDTFAEYMLGFIPQEIGVGYNGEFILMSQGPHIASIDMESKKLADWSTISNKFGWLDESMLYSVSNGDLYVYDYDGLNQRQLSNNVVDYLPVTITNDKWLYYFSNDTLIREWIVEH